MKSVQINVNIVSECRSKFEMNSCGEKRNGDETEKEEEEEIKNTQKKRDQNENK